MPTKAELLARKYKLNSSSVLDPLEQTGTAMVENKVQVLELVYDFSVQGGATGDIALGAVDSDDAILPEDALVVGADVFVVSELTSGGSATIALGAQADGDLIAAEAVASFTTGAIISLDTKKKTTADNVPYITVADAALTAGKFHVYIQYILAV
jgi:hypothetical protein